MECSHPSQFTSLTPCGGLGAQVVLSHTPYRALAQETPLGQQPVVVSGRKDTPAVARHYGFQKVVTTAELRRAYPHATPFAEPAGTR